MAKESMKAREVKRAKLVALLLTVVKMCIRDRSSAGKMGFRGSKKNTPYAAQMAAQDCAKVAFDLGLRKARVTRPAPKEGSTT